MESSARFSEMVAADLLEMRENNKSNCIAKKSDLSYSIGGYATCRLLLHVPRFNTRFMKDSLHIEALSFGTYCMLSSKYTDLADTSYL